ncbi:MAG TPA: hypothetical protein VFD58_30900 [Blastocatellia bacterium]|nr:hypothetical protein [Blastocatellia bacterium]
MKRTLLSSLAIFALLLGLAVMASADGKTTTLTGYIIDKKCSARGAEHSRECTLKCKGSGLGLYVDGKFYEFDAKGVEEAVKLMEASKSEKVIKATVEGELEDTKLTVKTIKLAE